MSVLKDKYGMVRDVWVICGFVVAFTLLVAVFTAVMIAAIISISIPYGRTSCRNWAKRTGVATKFTRLNFFDTGTCLAQAPDGRWVKNTSVQVFIPGAKR